jgi:hypothetical protein
MLPSQCQSCTDQRTAHGACGQVDARHHPSCFSFSQCSCGGEQTHVVAILAQSRDRHSSDSKADTREGEFDEGGLRKHNGSWVDHERSDNIRQSYRCKLLVAHSFRDLRVRGERREIS